MLSKRQDNYFLFVGKRQQKFWLRLHLPGEAGPPSHTRVLLAAKKHRELLFAKKSFVVTPVLWLYFQGKEAVTQCVLGQGFEVYKCNPTSLHTKPTWDHPPVNTSDCVRNNFLQWQQDVSINYPSEARVRKYFS